MLGCKHAYCGTDCGIICKYLTKNFQKSIFFYLKTVLFRKKIPVKKNGHPIVAK